MKHIVIAIIAVLSICLPVRPNWAADEIAEQDVFGNWALPENGSVVRVYRCERYLCVKVVKVADPRRRDINNPDPALRSRPLVGIVIGNNFEKADATVRRGRQYSALKWRGRLYSTLDGVTYDGTLNLLNKNTITMVGCVIQGLFCEAKTFYRVNTALPDGSIVQTEDTAPSNREVAVAPPPLPVRKPAPIPLNSLRGLFDRFLDVQSIQTTSRTFTKQERDALFRGFQIWLERQPAENRNNITELLTQ